MCTKIMSIEFENILQSCLSGDDLINFFLEGKKLVLKPLLTEEDPSPCFAWKSSARIETSYAGGCMNKGKLFIKTCYHKRDTTEF